MRWQQSEPAWTPTRHLKLVPKRENAIPKRRWNARKFIANLAMAAATVFVVWMLSSIMVAWFSSWILK